MNWIIYLMIKYNLFSNVGKFKEGDIVKYNWKAKYHINTVYERENKPMRILSTTSRISYETCDYISDDSSISSCDVFWLTKVKKFNR